MSSVKLKQSLDVNVNYLKVAMFKTVKAVLAAFMGIRSKDGARSDFEQLSLAQIIIVGVIGAALFVLALLLFVGYVTR